jgi:spore coat protein U-like protein
MKVSAGIWTLVILGIGAVTSQSAVAQTVCIDTTITPVNFGTYSVFSTPDKLTTGGIKIDKVYDCSNSNTLSSQTITVKLDKGGSGTYTPRKMTGIGANYLEYNLYVGASAGASVWGDGTNSTGTVTVSGTGNLNLPIYGAIPARQNAAVGNYSDTVTVTLEF